MGAVKPPIEPELAMSDIQGAVVPGFLKPHQTLLGVRIPEDLQTIRKFKSLLRDLAKEISNADVTLADRRDFRASRNRKSDPEPEGKSGIVLTGIGLSFPCLLRLAPGACLIPSEAFQAGMLKRSPLLGDSTDPADESNPANWVVGQPGTELDVLVVTAAESRKAATIRADKLAAQLKAVGVLISYREDGNVLEGKERGHEHFGFTDGISQPGIRGRASDGSFITARHLDPAIPESLLYGYPGQDLVWPGELVLGYPKTGRDPLLPGPADPPLPAWTRNGSFLVFRRLRQDVRLFWRTMRENARILAQMPGFKDMTDRRLASLLVGRWPSGAPVNRTPDEDIDDLGADPFANNSFFFDSDTRSLRLVNGHVDNHPAAKADPVGTTCPWAAHIRKLNTRDSASDMGGRESTYGRRLLRVGIPFGKQLDDECLRLDQAAGNGRAERNHLEQCDPENGNRGLLFMSIQASIEQQFEFLMSRWANNFARPKMPGGNDMLIGQSPGDKDGIRQCVLFGSDLQQQLLSTSHRWVIPTGGGYFFMPSISALGDVLAM